MFGKWKFPVVKFVNGRTVMIPIGKFSEDVPMEGRCIRSQVPLGLGWALTSHNMQGSEFNYMIYIINKVWEDGQVYTGISRSKDHRYLQIQGYDYTKVTANPLILSFYHAIEIGPAKIEEFLMNKAGQWWYPLLDHPEILSLLTKGDGATYTKEFRSWVFCHHPTPNYKGWKAPKTNSNWRDILFPSQRDKQSLRMADWMRSGKKKNS
jgi:hypothetical protein